MTDSATRPRRSRPTRILLLLGLVLSGVLCGLAVGIPAVLFGERWWAIPATLLMTSAWAVALNVPARIGFVVGWLVPVVAGAVTRGEGDYLIAGSLTGYLLLATGLVLVLATVVTLPGPRHGVKQREGAVGPTP